MKPAGAAALPRPGNASATLFHGFEPSDHGLHACPDLLVFLQQRRALGRQRILPLLQCAVLFLEFVADLDERVDALLQPFQLRFEGRVAIVSHGGNIELHPGRINRTPARESLAAWQGGAFHGIIAALYGTAHGIMESTIDHDELEAALRRCGSTWEVAQAHGLLCARLAAEGRRAGPAWLAQVMDGVSDDSPARQDCETLLDALFGSSYRQLTGRQSDFVLLLPDSGATTDARASALAHWCEGFLHGLVSGQRNESVRARLAEEPLADMLRDLLQITRATAEPGDSDDDTERAYTELSEYVRVAAQLAYEELSELRADRAAPGEGVLH